MLLFNFFFFFSSRRRHTRWSCDWSSDVCSSDLHFHGLSSTFVGCSHQPLGQRTSSLPSPLISPTPRPCANLNVPGIGLPGALGSLIGCISHVWVGSLPRSEERRVGKEGRSGVAA